MNQGDSGSRAETARHKPRESRPAEMEATFPAGARTQPASTAQARWKRLMDIIDR